MLEQITPVLLTYNERSNIGRTLSRLTWAKDVVVVDSGSTDGTLDILAGHPNVRVFTRQFDTHATQWRYAIESTQIKTEWVLRLDADYQVSESLINELKQVNPDESVAAYRIKFNYAVYGRRLRSSLYPPNTILFRKTHFDVHDRGHTEVWNFDGNVESLKGRILHDDWKPIEQWFNGQVRYMRLEADALESKSSVVRWLRSRPPLMLVAVFLYCLFGKGLIFDGRAGILYALQRTTAEGILALLMLEKKLRPSETETTNSVPPAPDQVLSKSSPPLQA
jgi:glycosyltransferase involved in cell wall biosynthesis